MKTITQIIFIILIFNLNSYAKPVLRVSISKGLKKRAVVAFPKTYGQSDYLKKTDIIIREDLKLSGLVSLIPLSKMNSFSSKESLTKTDFNAWQSLGTEYIVKVEIKKILGVDTITYIIFDNYSKKQLKKQKRSFTQKRFVETAHFISDQIILELTGKKGLGNTKIAFVSDKKTNKTIYSTDIQGMEIKQIVFDKSMVLSPDWGPNRESIIYTSYRNINPVIFIKYFSNNRFESVASFPGLNANGKINNRSEVVFTASKDGNPEIYKKNILSGKVKRLTRRFGVDANPSWSPDCKTIAFVSSNSGNPQIYLMDSNGNNIHRLTKGSSYSTSPAFSFDGRYLAYTTRIMGRLNLALYDFSTNNTEIIVSRMKNAEAPCWSPNSYHIAFSSNKKGKYNIYIIDIETKNKFTVTKNMGNCTNPTWK